MSWQKNPALNKKLELSPRQKSRTSQAMADAADINRIVATFLKTGQLPVSSRVPVYGDATALPGLQEALGQAQLAKQLYASLPDQVRRETGGDYRRLEGWLRDSRNTQLAIELGLLTPTKATPIPTAPTSPTTTATSSSPSPSQPPSPASPTPTGGPKTTP